MGSFKRIILFVVIAVLAAAVGFPASKRTSKDVKRDKQRTERQIKQTRKQIADNDRETSRQLARLESVKAELAKRNDTIAELRARIDALNIQISSLSDSLARLEARERSLKANYAKTLRTLRSRRQGMSDISFIFSAESFGQAWRRMRYLQEVAKTSTKQAKLLAQARKDVGDARESLQTMRQEQSAVLARQSQIQAALRTEQASADNLVKNLKKQGKSLQRELDRRTRQAKSLDDELDKIVEEEIRQAEERRRKEAEAKAKAEAEAKAKAEAEARAKAEAEAKAKAQAEAASKKKDEKKSSKTSKPAEKKPSKNQDTKSKPTTQQPNQQPKTTQPAPKPQPAPRTQFESEAEADRRLTGSFLSNKGRLLFPVAGKYSIVSNFGTNELPELSKVKVDNLGIDIEVPRGTSARAVFEGVVSSIFRLDGYNNIVIVRHGEYLSVYAGIDSLSVKKGDKVKAGQNLGKISPSASGDSSRLHFEIRHERQKLNPTEWVK